MFQLVQHPLYVHRGNSQSLLSALGRGKGTLAEEIACARPGNPSGLWESDGGMSRRVGLVGREAG